MCGIIYLKTNKNNLAELVKKVYARQKNRGENGFGFLAIKQGKVISYNRFIGEKETFDRLKKIDADEIIFHHRQPTSTANLPELNHPIRFSDDNYNYYTIHNGIISNDDKLYKKHKTNGIKYQTEVENVNNYRIVVSDKQYNTEPYIQFNDSEALAVEISLMLSNKQQDITAEGSIAFITAKVDKISKRVVGIYCGRNWQSPLMFGNEAGAFCLSSETGNQTLEIGTLFEVKNYSLANVKSMPSLKNYPTINNYGYFGNPIGFSNYRADFWEKESDDLEYQILETECELDEAKTNGDKVLVKYLSQELTELKAKLQGLKIKNNYAI